MIVFIRRGIFTSATFIGIEIHHEHFCAIIGNAELTYFSEGIQTLMSPRYEEHWQEVILVRYRSRRDFISMITSDAYQELLPHRTAGIKYDEFFPTRAVFNIGSLRFVIFFALAGIYVLATFVMRRLTNR